MCGLKYDVLIGSLQCCMITQAKTFFKLEISSADIKTHYYMLHAKKKKKIHICTFKQKKSKRQSSAAQTA